MLKNGTTAALLKLVLAFALGAGTAVAGAYSTFETRPAHQTDQDRTDKMLQEIREDIKVLLQRVPAREARVPGTKPQFEGWSNPPLPRKQAAN